MRKKRSRLVRVLEGLGLGLVAMLLSSLLLVCVLLYTDPGRNYLRNVALSALKDIFDKGGVTFARLEGDLLSRFAVLGVEVIDSNQGKMVTIDRIDATLSPWALLDNHVQLSHVTASGIDVYVTYNDKEVFVPIPKPVPPVPQDATETAAKPWIVTLEDLSLADATFRYGQLDSPLDYIAKHISLNGRLRIDPDGLRIFVDEGALFSDGLDAGVFVRLESRYLWDRFVIDEGEVTIGSSRIFVHGEFRDFLNVYTDLTFCPSYVSALDYTRLVPDYPLATSLLVEGTMKGLMEDLVLDMNVTAPGGGDARILYRMNLWDPKIRWALSVAAKNIDLPIWLGGNLPHGRIDAELGVIGTGMGDGDLERISLRGTARMESFPESRFSLLASMLGNVLRLEDLSVVSGTSKSSVSGIYDWNLDEAGLVASLNLPQLGALPLPMTGVRGSLSGNLSLSRRSAVNRVSAELLGQNLRLAGNEVARVSLQGAGTLDTNAPDLRGVIVAEGVQVGTTALRSLQASVSSVEKKDLRFEGNAIFLNGQTAAIAGGVSNTEEGMRVSLSEAELLLGPSLPLRLASLGEVTLRDESICWSPIAFEGAGTVSSKGCYNPQNDTIQAELHAHDLPLAPLRSTFAPKIPVVEGVLQLDAAISGALSSPHAKLSASLQGGRLDALKNLSIDKLEASYNGKQLALALAAREAGRDLLVVDAAIPFSLLKQELLSGPLSLSLTLDSLELEKLISFLPQRDMGGRVSLSATVAGSKESPTLEFGLDGRDVYVGDWRQIDVVSQLQMMPSSLSSDLRVSLGGSELASIHGNVAYPFAAMLQGQELDLVSLLDAPLQIELLFPSQELLVLRGALPQEIQAQLPLESGLVSSSMRLSGSLAAPVVWTEGTLEDASLSLAESELSGLSLSWNASLLDSQLEFESRVQLPGVREVLLHALLQLDVNTLLRLAQEEPTQVFAEVPLESQLQIGGVNPRELPWEALGGEPEGLAAWKEGEIWANVGLFGTVLSPSASISLGVDKLSLYPAPGAPRAIGPLTASLEGAYELDGLRGSLRAALADASIAGDISIALPFSKLQAYLAGADVSPMTHISLEGNGLSLADGTELLLGQREVSGRLGFSFQLDGILPFSGVGVMPPTELRLWGEGVGSTAAQLSKLSLFARLEKGLLRWDGRIEAEKVVSWLRLQGQMPLDTTQPAFVQSFTPILASFSAQDFDLGFFSFAAPGLRRLGGKVSSSGIQLSGTVSSPRLQGTLDLFDGELALQNAEFYPKDLRMQLVFAPNKIELAKFAMRSGRGEASLTGQIDLVDGKPKDVNFLLKADRLELPYDGTTFAYLNDLQASLKGELGEAVKGTLVVEKGELKFPETLTEENKNLMPLSPLEDVVVVSGLSEKELKEKTQNVKETDAPSTSPTKEEEAPITVVAAPLAFTLDIDLPGRFYITGSPVEGGSVNIELGGQLQVESKGENLSVVGAINLLPGSDFLLLANRFRFADTSNITFIGEDLDPRLGIEASSLVTTTPNAQNQSQEFSVNIGLRGTALFPQLAIRSTPLLDESRILLLLATGSLETAQNAQETVNQTTAAITQNLGALMGIHLVSWVQGSVIGRFAKKLVDVLRIDPGQVEAGFYVGKGCYVGVRYRFVIPQGSTTEQTEGSFVCRIGKQWGINGRYGGTTNNINTGGNTANVDILWSKDY